MDKHRWRCQKCRKLQYESDAPETRLVCVYCGSEFSLYGGCDEDSKEGVKYA